MAHFAEIDLNNIVLRVVVVANAELIDANHQENETKGIEFCQNMLGGNWVQTSYNGSIRKNYAGIGFTYDAVRDAFIPPKPYDSWVLDENTCQWEPPVVCPEDGKLYDWNEDTISWVEVTV